MPDHHNPLSRQEANQKDVLATERFRPILEKLADLERDDQKLAFHAARPARLYRRIWASCVPEHLDEENLGQNNKASRGANINPNDGKDGLQLRPDEQLCRTQCLPKQTHSHPQLTLFQEPLCRGRKARCIFPNQGIFFRVWMVDQGWRWMHRYWPVTDSFVLLCFSLTPTWP